MSTPKGGGGLMILSAPQISDKKVVMSVVYLTMPILK